MKRKSKYLDIAKKMPPLYHTIPGEDFDIAKSEVAKWLVSQPEILNYVVNRIKGSNGQTTYIVFDPKTRKWQGVDYDGS